MLLTPLVHQLIEADVGTRVNTAFQRIVDFTQPRVGSFFRRMRFVTNVPVRVRITDLPFAVGFNKDNLVGGGLISL